MACKECACLKAANLAVSEKERLRSDDIKSITTNGDPAVFPMINPDNNLVKAVFDCNPETVARVTRAAGAPIITTVCFKCAEYTREIETFVVDAAAPCGYRVQAGTYSVIEPNGTITAIPGVISTAPVSRKILGYIVSIALADITFYDFAVRIFGDKHVDIGAIVIPVDIRSKKDGGNDSVTIHPEFIDTAAASFGTANLFGGSNLRNIDVSGHLSGKFKIKNIGANAAIVRAHLLLTGSDDRNILLDDTPLAAGDSIWVAYGGLGDEPANTLRIEGIAFTTDSQTTIQTQGRGVN